MAHLEHRKELQCNMECGAPSPARQKVSLLFRHFDYGAAYHNDASLPIFDIQQEYRNIGLSLAMGVAVCHYADFPHHNVQIYPECKGSFQCGVQCCRNSLDSIYNNAISVH